MAVWNPLAGLWATARRVEDLFAFQGKLRSALDEIEARLHDVENRLTHLEAREGQLIVEAKVAAGVAATGLAASVIAEVVTRITRLEMRQDDIQTRLPPTRST